MRYYQHFALALAAILFPSVLLADKAMPAKPTIEIVFCIDCSGSMGGVIETAKQKVWTIVNEVARAKPSPILRIGLIGYGDGDRTYRIFPLTSDLDEVYKNLMTFKDEGWSQEYVGLSVHKATTEMAWTPGRHPLRLIYVVGNETARQGPAEMDYTVTAPKAIAAGIQINAIYCGDTDYQAATPTWRELAKLADGQYLEIAADGGAVMIESPYDAELARLNEALNATYLAYGDEGRDRLQNQRAQDENAAKVGGEGTLADRAAAKASRQYRNEHWDLVDASRHRDFDLNQLAPEQLPEAMRNMTPEDRKAYVEAKAEEREEIRNKILEVSKQRDEFVKKELARLGDGGDAFDKAVRESLVRQATEKGFGVE
jgi:hypothetical protein